MWQGIPTSPKGGEKWASRPLFESYKAKVKSRRTECPHHTCLLHLPAARLRGCRGSARLETFTAEDGAALGGAEGDGGLFSASRAGGLGLDLGVAVGLSGCGGDTEDGDPFGLTSFATLGFILELFVVKKKLFPGSENEITSTVDTLQHLVLKFH